MSTYHTVEQGEHLAGIAQKYGFTNFRSIWDSPENNELRSKREDPNVLFPGDRLFIPDRDVGGAQCVTEQHHLFSLIPAPKLMLRIVIKEAGGQPIRGTKCQLEIENTNIDLITDHNGLISQLISPTAKAGKVTFRDSEIPIHIGELDPVTEMSGWRARLQNLGYDVGQSTRGVSSQLRIAVEEFQCDYGLAVDGVCGPKTQAKLRQVYGC
jgi:N-acetylmuramoyl-L-alanine amidase